MSKNNCNCGAYKNEDWGHASLCPEGIAESAGLSPEAPASLAEQMDTLARANSAAELCNCSESLCKGWGATAGICRDAASYSIPPRNVPQPIPAPDLLDLLTAEVLSAATKPAIRQALGLLLHELGRRGMPPYSNLARTPALLAEQAAVIPPIGQFSSAEAAIAQGIDPTEAAGWEVGSGFGATAIGPIPADIADFWRTGATEPPSASLPPEVTIITPGHLPLHTEAATALCATSAGILTLKDPSQ